MTHYSDSCLFPAVIAIRSLQSLVMQFDVVYAAVSR